MKISNRIVALLAALALSVVAVACGNSAESSTPSESTPATEISEAAPASEAPAATGEQMTEEDYKAKVLELYTNVTDVAPELAAVDQTDAAAVLAATQKVAEVTKASYGEMGNLVAPDSFADVQVGIKEGAEASCRILDISLEMIELGQTEMTDEETTTKITEYQAELAELAVKAQKLSEGLIAVLGAEVVGGAAAAQ